MDTIALGPVVIAAPRLYAFAAFLVLVVTARYLERRMDNRLGDWAYAAALAALIGARVAYVLRHLGAFAPAPLSVFYIWQGGFDPWGAGLGALLYTGWRYRKSVRELRIASGLLVFSGLLLAGLNGIPLGSDLRGRPLPDLQLGELQEGGGIQDRVLEDFTGRPLLVNLWATWCPPCRRELPLLAERAAQDTTVRIVLIDQGEPADTVRGYLEERGLTFPHVLLDPGGRMAAAFGARGLPTTLVFDRRGRLIEARMGEVSRAWLDQALQKARPQRE